MDMEWAKDGISGDLFIVQARPETIHSQKKENVLEKYVLKQTGKKIVAGRSVGEKIGQGEAHVIRNVKDIHKFRKGEVAPPKRSQVDNPIQNRHQPDCDHNDRYDRFSDQAA